MTNKLMRALIKNNIISQWDCEKMKSVQSSTSTTFEDALLNSGVLDENTFCQILSREFNIKKVSLDNKHISKEIIKLMPKEIVKKYCVIPFEIQNNYLYVAMHNPLNQLAIEDIRFITNKQIIPFIEKKNKILCAIENYYENHSLNHEKYIADEELSEKNIETASIVKLTNSIINEAIAKEASDIHIEPCEDGTVVRFRIDGILREEMVIPKEIYPLVCTRIKIKSGMDISKKMLPQDGKMAYSFQNKDFDLRISSIPVLYGEKLAIRILYKFNTSLCLENLIPDVDQRQVIRKILNHPNGIILVTGPTGSGKTTTLCAMLNELNSREKNIVTIEEPVEYAIKGINQINVNNKAGLTFSTGLRSLLRQDPDIIMVGEIRDKETAQIAIRAAITGHLVLSTLHTNSAINSVTRLKDMDVPNYLIADSLVAVISQRLVRNICPNCKKEYYVDESKAKLYKGEGCSVCNGTGYKGRSALFEIMYINDGHRQLIREKHSSMDIKDFSIKNGMQTLNDRCKALVSNGITTLDEMMRVCYENI